MWKKNVVDIDYILEVHLTPFSCACKGQCVRSIKLWSFHYVYVLYASPNICLYICVYIHTTWSQNDLLAMTSLIYRGKYLFLCSLSCLSFSQHSPTRNSHVDWLYFGLMKDYDVNVYFESRHIAFHCGAKCEIFLSLQWDVPEIILQECVKVIKIKMNKTYQDCFVHFTLLHPYKFLRDNSGTSCIL